MKAVGIPAKSLGWLSDKKLSRVILVLGGLLLLAFLAVMLTYLLIQDAFAFGAFPSGVKIVGVKVGGLNKTEALQKVRTDLADVASKPLTLKIDDEEYKVSPEEIKLTLDYEAMVEKAYDKAWSVNIFERMFRRFLNRPKDINESLVSTDDRDRVHGWVSEAINSINRHPHDAYIDVTSGKPVIVKAKDGRSASLEELIADTEAALRRPDRTVNVHVGRVPPGMTDEVFGKFIIINLAEHKLTLYQREQPLAEFPVACGSAQYPTPVGIWKIVSKQRNPTWRNPGTAWARSMPPSIPPGPGNPLGTRALALNASGVLIHGTPSPWSIGSSVSHGCVRMYMSNVEQLFEMVEENTPVYVIKAAGDPGFDVTRKPFWQS